MNSASDNASEDTSRIVLRTIARSRHGMPLRLLFPGEDKIVDALAAAGLVYFDVSAHVTDAGRTLLRENR